MLSLSFMQGLQLSLPKDLEEEMGLPYHRISGEVRSRTSFTIYFSSTIACIAKCFANESEDSPLFDELTVLLKCCVILVFSFCCMYPI